MEFSFCECHAKQAELRNETFFLTGQQQQEVIRSKMMSKCFDMAVVKHIGFHICVYICCSSRQCDTCPEINFKMLCFDVMLVFASVR